MMRKLAGVIVSGTFGYYVASKSYVYAAETSQQTKAPSLTESITKLFQKNVQEPVASAIKEGESNLREYLDSHQDVKQKIEELADGIPAVKKRMDDLLKRILNTDQDTVSKGVEETKEVYEKVKKQVTSDIDQYINDDSTSKEKMSKILDSILNIEEELKDKVSGVKITPEKLEERKAKVAKSVEEFMKGDSSAKQYMNKIYDYMLGIQNKLKPAEQSINKAFGDIEKTRQDLRKKWEQLAEDGKNLSAEAKAKAEKEYEQVTQSVLGMESVLKNTYSEAQKKLEALKQEKQKDLKNASEELKKKREDTEKSLQKKVELVQKIVEEKLNDLRTKHQEIFKDVEVKASDAKEAINSAKQEAKNLVK